VSWSISFLEVSLLLRWKNEGSFLSDSANGKAILRQSVLDWVVRLLLKEWTPQLFICLLACGPREAFARCSGLKSVEAFAYSPASAADFFCGFCARASVLISS